MSLKSYQQSLAIYLILFALTLNLNGCTPLFIASTVAGLSIAYDKRTTGTILEDENIELKAYSRLSNEPFYNSSHLTINSYNLNLLIVGQVPSQQAKETILAKLKTIPRVKKIYNEIEIKKPLAFNLQAQDAWITGKIKTYLKTSSHTRELQIAVITENKNVYLMGLVSSKEADKITNLIRNISGVEKITRLFEYS